MTRTTFLLCLLLLPRVSAAADWDERAVAFELGSKIAIMAFSRAAAIEDHEKDDARLVRMGAAVFDAKVPELPAMSGPMADRLFQAQRYLDKVVGLIEPAIKAKAGPRAAAAFVLAIELDLISFPGPLGPELTKKIIRDTAVTASDAGVDADHWLRPIIERSQRGEAVDKKEVQTAHREIGSYLKTHPDDYRRPAR
jgi:hypothetical protein